MCSNNLPIITGLSAYERTAGSVARRESHKSISYQIATEWGDETDRYEDKIRID
jgi:hypothetical protein